MPTATFWHTPVLLGMCSYFLVCKGTFGALGYLSAHVGTFGHARVLSGGGDILMRHVDDDKDDDDYDNDSNDGNNDGDDDGNDDSNDEMY